MNRPSILTAAKVLRAAGLLSISLACSACLAPPTYDFQKGQRDACEESLEAIQEQQIDRVSIAYEQCYALGDKRISVENKGIICAEEWDIPQEQAQEILQLLGRSLRIPSSFTIINSVVPESNEPTYSLLLKLYEGEELHTSIAPLYIAPDSTSSYQMNADSKAKLTELIEAQLKLKHYDSPF